MMTRLSTLIPDLPLLSFISLFQMLPYNCIGMWLSNELALLPFSQLLFLCGFIIKILEMQMKATWCRAHRREVHMGGTNLFASSFHPYRISLPPSLPVSLVLPSLTMLPFPSSPSPPSFCLSQSAFTFLSPSLPLCLATSPSSPLSLSLTVSPYLSHCQWTKPRK